MKTEVKEIPFNDSTLLGIRTEPVYFNEAFDYISEWNF